MISCSVHPHGRRFASPKPWWFGSGAVANGWIFILSAAIGGVTCNPERTHAPPGRTSIVPNAAALRRPAAGMCPVLAAFYVHMREYSHMLDGSVRASIPDPRRKSAARQCYSHCESKRGGIDFLADLSVR